MSNTTDTITVDAPGARETFLRWLARGDTIGVFQNVDLGHHDMGRRVFIPLGPTEQALPIGKAHAPDGHHGLGWRYLLERIEYSLARFTFEGE